MPDLNPLISGLKQYADTKEMITALEQRPILPEEVRKYPAFIRINEHLNQIEDLFVPGPSQFRTADTIQRMITGYYRSLSPASPIHINNYYNRRFQGYTKPIGCIIHGQSGVGKSRAVLQALTQYPQVIEHDDFPHFKGRYLQVVWFSVSIRSHTKKGFAAELAQAWNDVFLRHDPDLPPPIPHSEIAKADPDQLVSFFLQSALVHNLGFIHIDEIQTLFRIAPKKKYDGNPYSEIAVKDDISLGKILGLFNTGIPILISCTSDGLQGLTSRGAVSQRIGLNHIRFDRFKTPDDPYYKRSLNVLMQYQYTDMAIEMSDDIGALIHHLTAGIYRIMVHCYIGAQKRALTMGNDSLSPQDLIYVHKDLSDDIKKTIQALHNKDRRFLDTKPDYRFEEL